MSFLNKLIAVIIIFSIVIVVLGTEKTITDRHGEIIRSLEIFILAVFIFEYFSRLWIAGLNSKYSGFKGAIKYALSPLAIIDLLAIVPFLFSGIGSESVLLRFVRLLRLISLAKFGRFSKAMKMIFSVLYEKRYELFMSLVLAFSIMFVSATALYLVEGNAQPEQFGSIPRSMWWAIVTLTTVGYGDVFPITGLGKFFAALSALAGVGLIALPTGVLASAFNSAFLKSKKEGES